MILEHRAAHCGRSVVMWSSADEVSAVASPAQARDRCRGAADFARTGRVGRRAAAASRSGRGSRGRAFVDPRDGAPTATVSPSWTSVRSGRRDRRGHLDADLVGFEARDRLIRRDRFARLLQPLGERSFGDRFPQRGTSTSVAMMILTPPRRGARPGCYGRAPRAIKAACSAAWRLASPSREKPQRRVRVLGRFRVTASARHCSSRSSTKSQAPLFFGSSCAQTSSSRFGRP